MTDAATEAKDALEREGLIVSTRPAHGLLIAAAYEDHGRGIRISHDACGLFHFPDGWVASFPSEGNFAYDIPGDPPELVALIADVYRAYRRLGGSFVNAVKQSIPGVDQYRSDRQPRPA